MQIKDVRPFNSHLLTKMLSDVLPVMGTKYINIFKY